MEKLESKIDLVITYVDSTDKNWQELYNQYVPKTENQEVNGKQRFRKSGNFKYVFRGVDKYMPWINNVFLVVQSKSQVPDWLLPPYVTIITHDQFIPQEYLPVFNSQAIEMFLHKIPGLSESFIYSNDDVYFIGPLKQTNFFVGNKIKSNFKIGSIEKTGEIQLWKKATINSGNITNKKETEKLMIANQYITPMHIARPYFKSTMEEVHSLHSESILSSISRFREPHNLTIYLYDFYLKEQKRVIEIDYQYIHYSSKTKQEFISHVLINPEIYKIMCLNDTLEEIDLNREKYIEERFNQKFPLKSKYEV